MKKSYFWLLFIVAGFILAMGVFLLVGRTAHLESVDDVNSIRVLYEKLIDGRPIKEDQLLHLLDLFSDELQSNQKLIVKMSRLLFEVGLALIVCALVLIAAAIAQIFRVEKE